MFDLEKLLLHDAKNHINAINILLRRNYTYDFNVLDFNMIGEILADVAKCNQSLSPSTIKSISRLNELYINFNLDEKKVISPIKVLSEVLSDFNYSFIEKNYMQECFFAKVEINPIILKHFYKILICNSLDAKTKDKQTFKINLEAKIISNNFEFIISDDGVGISDDIKEKILSKEKIPYSTKQTGWGVGLYLIQNYFKQNEGSFELVYSGVNEGTSFKLCLPIENREGILH